MSISCEFSCGSQKKLKEQVNHLMMLVLLENTKSGYKSFDYPLISKLVQYSARRSETTTSNLRKIVRVLRIRSHLSPDETSNDIVWLDLCVHYQYYGWKQFETWINGYFNSPEKPYFDDQMKRDILERITAGPLNQVGRASLKKNSILRK